MLDGVSFGKHSVKKAEEGSKLREDSSDPLYESDSCLDFLSHQSLACISEEGQDGPKALVLFIWESQG